jgi:hypothetical protein
VRDLRWTLVTASRAPDMTTATLRFTGPGQEARVQLVRLLREFPRVSFRERGATEYEVSAAEEAELRELGRIPGWSLAGPR